MRKCSASIAANIAEGCGRRGNAEFHRFLQIAAGSASELEYHILMARDLGYLEAVNYETMNFQVGEIKKMLSSLIRKVNSERSRPGSY